MFRLGVTRLSILVTGILVGVIGIVMIFTQISTAEEATAVSVTNVHDTSIYRAGDTINVTGIVNGDVYCAGNTVTVNAIVNGDILCTASTISIEGTVTGDIRVVASDVAIYGVIKGGSTIIASNVSVSENASIKRDASIIASYVTIDGSIQRDLNIRASNITLVGNIGRNIDSYHQVLEIRKDAGVGGSLTYTSPKLVYVPDGVVEGSVTRVSSKSPNDIRTFMSGSVFIMAILLVAVYVSLLVMALGVSYLFPKTLDDSLVQLKSQPIQTLVVGGVVLIGSPILLFVLTLSIIGIPLALLLSLLYWCVLLLSAPFVAHAIGAFLFPDRSHPVRALAGATLLLIVLAIPVLNIVIFTSVVFVGVGMIGSVAFTRYSSANKTYKSSLRTKPKKEQ